MTFLSDVLLNLKCLSFIGKPCGSKNRLSEVGHLKNKTPTHDQPTNLLTETKQFSTGIQAVHSSIIKLY